MLRSLLHFFLIGGLLFSAKAAFRSAEGDPPEITVVVPADASKGKVENEIRNAILLNEARRYGWYRNDPVVFTHLVRNMRFIEPDSSDDNLTLFKRALEMGMQEHDPVVRARLLYRAREALSYVPEDQMPSRDELEAHREAHPDRFEREGKVRFEHVFLSRTKRRDAVVADAAAMRDELEKRGDERPSGLGDPLPGLRAVQSSSPSQIRNSYGIEFANLVEKSPVGSWQGPATTVYGLHFIRVLSKEPPFVPALDIIEAEVRANRLSEIREELRKKRMEALRDAYVVHIERLP